MVPYVPVLTDGELRFELPALVLAGWCRGIWLLLQGRRVRQAYLAGYQDWEEGGSLGDVW
jgi:hypothetical protein